MSTRALQEDPQSPCWKSSVSFTSRLQLCQPVWGIKLQLLLTATRCRQGPAPCFWWQTVRCNGGSEGWILFLHTTIHHQEWPGEATHLLGLYNLFIFLACGPTIWHLSGTDCQIESGCLLGLSQLILTHVNDSWWFTSVFPIIKQKLVEQLPLENILLETDSPALGPEKRVKFGVDEKGILRIETNFKNQSM